jgi:N6-L-threonylcarbamoyladenine synthase/protein kinase Bud32
MEMRIVGEGAEAKIYRGKLLGMDVAVKKRTRKNYRIQFLDDIIRTSRTKTEAKILSILAGKEICVPALLMVSKNTIYMDWIPGKRLSTIPEYDPKMQHYIKEAGRFLGIIHNEDVSHGDYTPANFIANGQRLYVIDFGLACITNSVEDKALDVLLMKRSIKKQLYTNFLNSYKKSCKEHSKILDKLKEIEIRGRYQTRTLASL